MEVWKPIPGVPKYEVSDMGNIRHIKRKKPLKLQEDYKGYLLFYYVPARDVIWRPKRRRRMLVHRAVAMAFLPDPPYEGCSVDHIEGCRQDNRVSKLRWATVVEQNINRETTFVRRTWGGEPDAEVGYAGETITEASFGQVGFDDGTLEEI